MSWFDWAESELEAIDGLGRRRSIRAFDAFGPSGQLGGASVLSFAANDYLGLSTHPDVLAAAHDAIERWGTGATASRLIVGSRPTHHELEHALAEWKQAEAALVFSSGFAANYGVISTLSAPGVTVLSDELNHASLIDGCRAGRGEVSVFRHNDLDEVAARLAAAPGRVMVVTESVFSMDGDLAPLTELSVLCAAHRALLVIDDAHGVLGSPPVVPDATVLWLGTLSKTLASQGGYVAGPAPIVDLIVNRARSFIFSTGLSPADAAAASAALGVFTSDSGSALRRYLAAAVERVAPGHRSPIIPVVLGSEHAALAASRRLLDAGLLVPAIRPPTVPPGTSRLRIALSAAHTSAMIDRLLSGLAEVSRAA